MHIHGAHWYTCPARRVSALARVWATYKSAAAVAHLEAFCSQTLPRMPASRRLASGLQQGAQGAIDVTVCIGNGYTRHEQEFVERPAFLLLVQDNLVSVV